MHGCCIAFFRKYSFSVFVCPQTHVPVLPWLLMNISWPLLCCLVFRPPRFGLIYFDTRVTGNTTAVNRVTTPCQYNGLCMYTALIPTPDADIFGWYGSCAVPWWDPHRVQLLGLLFLMWPRLPEKSPRWLHIFFLLIVVVSLHENAAWPWGLIWADDVLTQFYRRRRSRPSLPKWSKDAVIYYTRRIGMLLTM